MKSPITGKDMYLVTEKRIMVFRKEEFEYIHHSYHCKDSGEFFTTTELDEISLTQVYNQYRDKHNIPFPDEISNLRKRYNLTANKISKILGFGINSYRNYEKGEVPSLANAKLINAVLNSIGTFKSLVKINTELSDREKIKILKNVEVVIDDYHTNKDDIRFEDVLLGDKLPDNYSGYRRPNMTKMSEMIIFFAEKLKPSETMMNKLLFYSDFLNYRKSAYSISGVRYMAHNYGPVPIRYGGIFDYVSSKNFVDINIEDYMNGYVAKRFYSSEGKFFNPEIFNKVELSSLNQVANTFKNCNAGQIKDRSHEEKAWIENEKAKSMIDYNYAFDLIHVK